MKRLTNTSVQVELTDSVESIVNWLNTNTDMVLAPASAYASDTFISHLRIGDILFFGFMGSLHQFPHHNITTKLI